LVAGLFHSQGISQRFPAIEKPADGVAPPSAGKALPQLFFRKSP